MLYLLLLYFSKRMSKSMGEDVVKKKYELSMFRDYLEKSHQIMCNLVFYNDN